MVVILVILAVVGLFTFRGGRQSAQAQDKATELVATLHAAGLPTPTTEQIVGVLGTNGGAVCAGPNDALYRALVLDNLTTGTGGSGMRPIIAERQVLTGTLAVMKVYCPKEVPDFQKFVDNLQTTNTEGS
ncbi:hypothetical protein [Leifsonia sp. EB41]|uniref:hypothetical protein n=1 Tax=Leifsonia sp. EB41 TaxID=3156260 RepID=UPI003517C714